MEAFSKSVLLLIKMDVFFKQWKICRSYLKAALRSNFLKFYSKKSNFLSCGLIFDMIKPFMCLIFKTWRSKSLMCLFFSSKALCAICLIFLKIKVFMCSIGHVLLNKVSLKVDHWRLLYASPVMSK